ncbi:MAG TPA: serine/threonine-protein kinase [Verrucomicrobiae bacterium]
MTTHLRQNICPKCQSAIPADAPGGLCPKCVLAGVGTTADGSLPGLGDIPAVEQLKSIFPQLEINELIGRGGMGFVFKARQLHLERDVALKLLPEKLSTDPHFADRFTREARVLARLNHPNIVMVHDFGHVGGFYYLLMEYVEGLNLRQAMRMGKFSPAEALAIVPKICDALQYAHEEGILHRDIKPENLLLDTRGRVKIADFGIAKLVGEQTGAAVLTGTGASLGTPHYMAPEQFENPAGVDHRADIYSLGVVFYEMLTGELPLGRFSAPSARADLDDRIDAIVMRALARERELRQQNARQFQTEVETVAATTRPAAPEPAAVTGSTLRRFWIAHRNKLAWSATALVLILMACIILVQASDHRRLLRQYYANANATIPPEAVQALEAPAIVEPVAFNGTTPLVAEDPVKLQRDAEAIALSREKYEMIRARHSNGTATDRELHLAHRDLLITEARGDALKIAKAEYDFQRKEFDRARETGGPQETWRAASDLSKAQHAIEIAEAGTNRVARARADLRQTERAFGDARSLHLSRVNRDGVVTNALSAEDLRNFENEYLYAKQRYEQLKQTEPSPK